MKENFISLKAPIDGVVKPLYQSEDEAVASGLLGRGILIEPIDDKVYAPCDGIIGLVYATKHAIIMKSDTGIDILIHVGLDTGLLNGAGFDVFVSDGQRVHAGQLMLTFKPELIKSHHLQLVVPFLFPNLNDDDFMAILSSNECNHLNKLINIRKISK